MTSTTNKIEINFVAGNNAPKRGFRFKIRAVPMDSVKSVSSKSLLIAFILSNQLFGLSLSKFKNYTGSTLSPLDRPVSYMTVYFCTVRASSLTSSDRPLWSTTVHFRLDQCTDILSSGTLIVPSSRIHCPDNPKPKYQKSKMSSINWSVEKTFITWFSKWCDVNVIL